MNPMIFNVRYRAREELSYRDICPVILIIWLGIESSGPGSFLSLGPKSAAKDPAARVHSTTWRSQFQGAAPS